VCECTGVKALARNESERRWELRRTTDRSRGLPTDLSRSTLGLTRKKVNYAWIG
jgi:hypothetical protein